MKEVKGEEEEKSRKSWLNKKPKETQNLEKAEKGKIKLNLKTK